MDKELERLIRINVIRDIQIEFLKAKECGFIVPDNCFDILKILEKQYNG